ncbi:putative ankyrin repeat-containing domain, PGG domain, retrotransposon copia-like protein [Tanacetum coccineum]
MISGCQQYPYPCYVNAASFVSIKLSNKSNYRPWEEQLMCLVESHDMLGFIDGTIKSPKEEDGDHLKKKGETTVIEDKYKEWKRSDTLVKGWIFGSLTEHVMETVVGLHTSSDVWTMLKNTYSSTQAAPRTTTTTVSTTSNINWKEYRPLYGAIVNGHWEKAREYFINDKNALIAKMNDDHDSPLHLGIGTCKNIHFVENLLKEIHPESLPTLVCKRQQNPLHRAALVGNTKAAKMLVEKNPYLLFIPDKQNFLPIHRAIFGSHDKTFFYLLEVTKRHIELSRQSGYHSPFEGINSSILLTNIIGSGHFGNVVNTAVVIFWRISVVPFEMSPILRMGNVVLIGLNATGGLDGLYGEDGAFYKIAYELIKEYPDIARTKKGNTIPLKSIAGKLDAYLSGTRYNFYQKFDQKLDNAHDNEDIENQLTNNTRSIAESKRSCFHSGLCF